MAEPNAGGSSSDSRRKATRKRTGRPFKSAPPDQTPATTPCGACKFLRRKCIPGCIFAPHFTTDHGAALFAAVHKVFGASNVSKLLMHLPVHRRPHAIATISYEAQARLFDPVYGCISTVIGLQLQVAALQTELAMVQNQLINNRVSVATAIQGSLQQPTPVHHLVGYTNGPSASNNNVLNMNNFDPFVFADEML
ncbi:unnamed protein product [Lactuca saligna]|uniref:LOB domain-containing protein n=1 Tax=Lactuca saligna TaxID=75948 RepID=A0AA35ZBW3_LACSI|nr:unnamed protein product [Lactuca saligna]